MYLNKNYGNCEGIVDHFFCLLDQEMYQWYFKLSKDERVFFIICDFHLYKIPNQGNRSDFFKTNVEIRFLDTHDQLRLLDIAKKIVKKV